MSRNMTARNRTDWMLLGTTLLILGALLAYSVYAERGEISALEAERMQVQARVIDENLGRQLEGVNHALAGIRDDLLRWNGKTMQVLPSNRLRVLSEVMPGVRTLHIANAQGTVVDSNRIELIGQEFGDREYFKAPRERQDPAVLYVSPPYKTQLGVFSIDLSRVLTDSSGEFAGVVSATLDPEYFNVLLRSVLYASDMRVVLSHWDGKAFLFMPVNERAIGLDLAKPGSFFSRHRESGQTATLLTSTSVTTGDERMMASRSINRAGLPMDKPLLIHVSRSTSAMYLPWRAQSLVYGVLFGLFAAAASLGLYLLQRRRREMDGLAAAQDQERRESKERLELALAGGDLGLWDWHVPSGRMTLNERWVSMLGYQAAEIEPHIRTWERLVHPDDAPSVRAELDKQLKGETPGYRTEHRLRHKEGHWIWILDRGKVMERDAAGAPLRMVGTYMDITEQKQKIEEYRTVVQASLDGFWITDYSGRIIEVNDAICRMLGYSRDELLRMSVADIEAEESSEEIAGRIRGMIPTGSALIQGRHRRKDGKVIAVEVNVLCVAALGERFFVFVRDVSERKAAEEKLKKSVAFSELLSEAMPLPVFHKDASGRYTGCNSAFTRFIGKAKSEIVGKTVFEVSPQNLAENYRDRDLDLLEDSLGLQTYESAVAHADGTTRDVIFHKARITDESGAPTGIVGVITDITEIRQVQAKRDQLEAQLRQSQKMEALGTLAGGVAHDFNNIIAAIMGNVELAAQDAGSGHAALESLDEIRKASLRAKDLVQQILAFGRRQKALRKVIALAPVVEESVRLLRATLPAGVRLTVACEPDAPTVLADATQVEQVLLNLCSNAWHAVQNQARPGTITVRLQAHERESVRSQETGLALAHGEVPPGRYACVTVQDNGSGMDKETLAHIFEPFFTTKPVDMGTGLGLAVVHGIAQEHGAGIEVQSVPGEGSAFRVYFPAAEAPAQAARARATAVTPARGQGKHVLFVDDDEAIVFLMTRLLERQGYRVSGFIDARAALAAARADPAQFDLAVTDYNMPGMSGLDVARALHELRADLPIAVASGYITDELRALAPAAGVRELVYKPNTVDELCEVVSRLALGLAA